MVEFAFKIALVLCTESIIVWGLSKDNIQSFSFYLFHCSGAADRTQEEAVTPDYSNSLYTQKTAYALWLLAKSNLASESESQFHQFQIDKPFFACA